MKFIIAFILGYLALIDCAIVRPAKRSSVCSTKACINKANEILSRMDTRANPCESFYNFACGNYIKAELSNTEISRSSLDQINKNLMVYISSVLKQPISAKDIEPIRDAKSYYQSCLKTDLVNRLSESYLTKFINDEFGGWPILNAYLGTPISVGSRLSSLQLMVKLEEYRVQPLLMLFVTNHPKNAKARVIKLKQPQLLPPQLVVNQQFQMAYLSYVKEFLMYLSPKAGFVADLEIAAMNELGNQLSMSGVNPVASQKAGYKNITIKQLQYYIPKFPWKDYIINGVFKTAGAKITENEHILVEDWDYLTKFAEIFNVYSTFNKQTLDNFLIMSFVNSLAIDYMPFRYLQLKQNFMKLLTGVSQVQERGVYCATKTNSIMGFVTSRMFIDSYFDKNIKPKVKQMTDTIISALRDTLDQVTWMDARSKKLAREKVDNIKARVAYPDNIFNNTYLDSLYEFDLDVDHFLKNGIKTTRVLTLEAYRDVSNLRDKEEWIAPPTFANAFYDPSSNQITLPAAVLSPPFYDENVPNYLNFGAIGSIIGHELTHGFDNAGRHFDKDGLFFFDSEMGLWSQKTIESYLNRTECMVNQYNHFKDAETNMNINGALTLNENIADNGGIKQAYNAYKKWIKANGEEPLLPRLDSYTQEQLFFISNAQAFCSRVRPEAKMLLIRTDSHALAAFRVLGATSNMAEFGKAFNCKVGQTNHPAKKCTVW